MEGMASTDGGAPTGTSGSDREADGSGGNRIDLSRDWTLFRTLWLEEWRLHTSLFGGRRFYAFPLVIAALVSLGSLALLETGYSSASILLGVHLTVLAFGFYSGTAAFAGSDMLENVFGDLSLLLGSGHTLPLSERRLLGHFLCKDALFYAITIVFPLSLVVVALEGLTLETPIAVFVTWLSLSLVFTAGMAVTLALIALRTRGLSLRLSGLSVLGVVGLWALSAYTTLLPPLEPPAQLQGLGLHQLVLSEGTLWGWLAVFGGTAILSLAALRIYDPEYSQPARSGSGRLRFETLESLPGSGPLVNKTLLDLVRSSGGLWKPIVSVTILLAVVAFLVTIVREITGIEPALGVFYGSVLGLSAFTTYNWLTQFDAVESYLTYPVRVEAVFRAKRVAFYLVGLPTMTLAYAVAVLWSRPPALDVLTGFVLLIGLAQYYYGLTVFIAGFDPNEFLFDGVRFVGFTLGVACVLVPTLVVGFVVVPLSSAVAAGLSTLGVVAGVSGYWLATRASGRWATRYRHGRV